MKVPGEPTIAELNPKGMEKAAQGNIHTQKNIRWLWGMFPGQDAFVVGTGPSLSGFDFTRLKGKLTIALNDAVKAPGFDPQFHIFCDVGIWHRYRDMKDYPVRTAMVCQPRARKNFQRHQACNFDDQIWHFNHVSVAAQCKVENDDLFVARTVATGGIMLAWKLGARRIFLLGVDGYKLADRYYWDGRKKKQERRQEKYIDTLRPKLSGVRNEQRIQQDRHGWWEKNMNELRKWFDKRKLYQEEYRFRAGGKAHLGSNIFNLSGRSTITAWQKVKMKTIFGKGCFSE